VEGSPEMESILHHIRDTGFDGTMAFEIEDMNLTHELSSEEKILFLRRQARFVRDCIG
jgi:hypothetical protein